MQRRATEDVHLRQTLDPNHHTGKVKSFHIYLNFNEKLR